MTPAQLNTLAITPGLSLLPEKMDTPAARRMLVAIAAQESDLKYRQQVLKRGRAWWEWRGPARGWWQFEPTGLKGVLTHRASMMYAASVMDTLGYSSPAALMPVWLSELHGALKHQDALACAMARLLLWTLPQRMAETPETGFSQYLAAWRPGAWDRGSPGQRAGLRVRWMNSWRIGQEAISGTPQ